MDIVAFVAEKVGLEKSQAETAVALILKFAKGQLGDNFDKIAAYIPGVNDLLAKAPEDDGGGVMGAVGGLASSLMGGKGGGLASLAAGFTGGGLSPDKIPDTAGAVADFVGEKGGDEMKSLLASVLK